MKKDRTRLRKMLTHCHNDDSAMSVENAVEALDRLERADVERLSRYCCLFVHIRFFITIPFITLMMKMLHVFPRT